MSKPLIRGQGVQRLISILPLIVVDLNMRLSVMLEYVSIVSIGPKTLLFKFLLWCKNYMKWFYFIFKKSNALWECKKCPPCQEAETVHSENPHPKLSLGKPSWMKNKGRPDCVHWISHIAIGGDRYYSEKVVKLWN